jgi:hypothetical protein
MSPRWNWDSPNPSPASECNLPTRTKGWGDTLASGYGDGGVPIPRKEKAWHSAYSVQVTYGGDGPERVKTVNSIYVEVRDSRSRGG